VTNDPMEAHVIGFNMWVKAVEKAGSVDPDKVIDALPGTKAPNLTGGCRKCFRTITSPSLSSSAKSKLMVSSTWCGRPRPRGWRCMVEGA
jgi:urea transport system substrate-binding protein